MWFDLIKFYSDLKHFVSVFFHFYLNLCPNLFICCVNPWCVALSPVQLAKSHNIMTQHRDFLCSLLSSHATATFIRDNVRSVKWCHKNCTHQKPLFPKMIGSNLCGALQTECLRHPLPKPMTVWSQHINVTLHHRCKCFLVCTWTSVSTQMSPTSRLIALITNSVTQPY